MCSQCDELDAKIKRYRELVREGFDHLTVDRIKGLITDLETKRANMHPE